MSSPPNVWPTSTYGPGTFAALSNSWRSVTAAAAFRGIDTGSLRLKSFGVDPTNVPGTVVAAHTGELLHAGEHRRCLRRCGVRDVPGITAPSVARVEYDCRASAAITLDVHHPSPADVHPLGEGLTARHCRQRAGKRNESQQFHDEVFHGCLPFAFQRPTTPNGSASKIRSMTR